MKKGLGLQANINSFNTTLPQTKHLNFFMGTNPVGYANGGDVRRGVPSSNMNVTQGFLPMALGFDNGGDVSKVDQFYQFLNQNVKEYFKRYFGKDATDAEVNEFLQTPQGENITNEIRVIYENEYGSGVSAGPYDSGFPIGGAQTKEPPKPTDTFSTAGDATKNIKPDSVLQQQFPTPQDSGLITPSAVPNVQQDDSAVPKKDDGSIDYGGIFKDIIEGGKGIIQEYGPGGDYFKDDSPKVEEKDIKKNKKDNNKITAEATPDPTQDFLEESKKDKGGITTITGGSGVSAGAYDSGFPINKKEEKDANELMKGGTDNKGKKDIPSWALPLASAGFAMMASKSPNFLQALGEGGQEGLKTLTAQQEAKLDREDRKSARDLQDAQAAYYRGEGRTTGTPFIAGGRYYRMGADGAEEVTTSDGQPLIAKRTLKEIVEDLETKYGVNIYNTYSDDKKAQLVREQQAIDLGSLLSNANIPKEEKEGFIKSIIEGFGNYKDSVLEG